MRFQRFRKKSNMQVYFTDITYDAKYIYATGTNTVTGEVRKIRISTDGKEYWCSGDIIERDRIFYGGAVELWLTLNKTGKLPKEKCCTWT
jgi:hypothetical protein